jgi:hypothetical protein
MVLRYCSAEVLQSKDGAAVLWCRSEKQKMSKVGGKMVM